MGNRRTGRTSALRALAILWLVSCGTELAAEVTNASAAAPPDVRFGEALWGSLHAQAQLEATQLAVERSRQEGEAALERHAQLLDTRLRLLEQALVGERARELDSLETSQRWLLVFAGLFACAGLLSLLLTAHAQWRAAERLAIRQSMESAPSRLPAAFERLEERVHGLEYAVRPSATTPIATMVGSTPGVTPAPAATVQAKDAGRAARIEVLLAKGQTLLNLERAEEALACFDEALTCDPQHAEALLKKAAALERVCKPDEAIACYDRAIATDHCFTMAYLQKGGLCNRLERYEEALKCYEEALKVQAQTSRAG